MAAVLVHRALRQYSWTEIAAALDEIDGRELALALLFTAGSFAALTGVDALAVRYTGHPLPYRRTALASFVSLSIGHTLGFAALSSGALRYRFYTGWGLSAGDVGRVILFCGAAVALGFATVGGVAAVAARGVLAEAMSAEPALIGAAGVTLLVAVIAYVAAAALVSGTLRIRRFELPMPPLRLALGQVALGSADALLVAGVMHQLITAVAGIDYLVVAAAYVGGNSLGIVTHVPGGLGVIEAVVVSLVPGAHVVAALAAFRVVYYLVPFALGCLALLAAEVARWRTAAAGRGGAPGSLWQNSSVGRRPAARNDA